MLASPTSHEPQSAAIYGATSAHHQDVLRHHNVVTKRYCNIVMLSLSTASMAMSCPRTLESAMCRLEHVLFMQAVAELVTAVSRQLQGLAHAVQPPYYEERCPMLEHIS